MSTFGGKADIARPVGMSAFDGGLNRSTQYFILERGADKSDTWPIKWW